MTPMLSYLVCATPRSGSTLLCQALDQTGVAGQPEEYFEALHRSGLPASAARVLRPRAPREHRRTARLSRDARRAPPSPNPLWHPETYDQLPRLGARTGHHRPTASSGRSSCGATSATSPSCCAASRGMAARPLPELLARAFPGLRYVQITREDKVRQAVSLWKAVQTQAWKREAGTRSSRRGGAGVLLSRHQLPRAGADRPRRLLGRLLPRSRLRAAEAHLRGAGRRAPRGSSQRVLEHLGIPFPTCSRLRRRDCRSRPTRSPRTGFGACTSTSPRSRPKSRSERPAAYLWPPFHLLTEGPEADVERIGDSPHRSSTSGWRARARSARRPRLSSRPCARGPPASRRAPWRRRPNGRGEGRDPACVGADIVRNIARLRVARSSQSAAGICAAVTPSPQTALAGRHRREARADAGHLCF